MSHQHVSRHPKASLSNAHWECPCLFSYRVLQHLSLAQQRDRRRLKEYEIVVRPAAMATLMRSTNSKKKSNIGDTRNTANSWAVAYQENPMCSKNCPEQIIRLHVRRCIGVQARRTRIDLIWRQTLSASNTSLILQNLHLFWGTFDEHDPELSAIKKEQKQQTARKTVNKETRQETLEDRWEREGTPDKGKQH